MKTYLLAFVALLLGGWAAYYVLAITFNLPYTKYFPIIFLPVGIVVGTSFVLGALDREFWWLQAGLVALPTVLLALFLATADWMGLVLIAVAIGICVTTGWLGQKTRGITMR